MIHVSYNSSGMLFHGLLLSVMSIAKHSSESVSFHILSADFSNKNEKWKSVGNDQIKIVNDIIKKYNPDHRAELIDCGDLYEKYFAHGRNGTSIYTPFNLLRLFVDLVDMDGDPEKLIHIDVDTMCLKDIKELYDIDIENYEFGAALDFLGKTWINKQYTNAGVLLLNLKKIRETGLYDNARRRVYEKTMAMPDQSALNAFVKHKLILPDKFNEQRDIKEDTVIKHFCKGIKFYFIFPRVYNYKQWQVDIIHNKLKIHDFDDIYEDFDTFRSIYSIE